MNTLSIETEVALRRLVDQYCEGVIRRNADTWGATWAEDASWNLGPGRQVAGRTEIVKFWTTAMGAFDWVIQVAQHFSFDIDEAAGTGTGRVIIRERFQRADGVRGDLLATYIDAYTKKSGQWLFSDRVLEVIERNPPM